MSTHALITILVYLVLNIQNAKSSAAVGTFQSRVSVTISTTPAEFELFRGAIATPGEASALIIKALVGIESESEPTTTESEPSEPTTTESEPTTTEDIEPQGPQRRLFANYESELYITGATIENNVYGGCTCECHVSSDSSSDVDTAINLLFEQKDDTIPDITAAPGGMNLLAGSATIDDVVSDNKIGAPSTSTCQVSTVAASFSVSSEAFVSYSAGSTVSDAGTNMVQTQIESRVASASFARRLFSGLVGEVEFLSSTVSNNPCGDITVVTDICSESLTDVEIIRDALTDSYQRPIPTIEAPNSNEGTDLSAGSATVSDALDFSGYAYAPYSTTLAVTTNTSPDAFKMYTGEEKLSTAGTNFIMEVLSEIEPTAKIDFGPSIVTNSGTSSVLIKTTVSSESESQLESLTTAVEQEIGETFNKKISAPDGSGGTDFEAGTVTFVDVVTTPIQDTLSLTGTPTGTPTDTPTDTPTGTPTDTPTGATSNPTKNPTDDDDNNDDDDSNGSNSSSNDDNAAAGLFDENKQLYDNNNALNVSLGFSNETLLNIWLLFGIFIIINIIFYFMCNTRKRGVTKVVEALSTV